MGKLDTLLSKAAGNKEEKIYFLMNKDRVVSEFVIEGEGELEVCIGTKGTADMPLYFGSIDSWVANRSAAKHRKHVSAILEQCGGKSKAGFISLTRCLSLNDTFWVKSEYENLCWSDVNLFDNEFSDVISKVAFDGVGLYGEKFSTTSPELTTDGAFDKCWIRKSGNVFLIKAGSTGASNAGREPYSEVLASQVFSELLGNDSVRYVLERFHGKAVSSCKLFTSEDIAYLPHSVFIRNKPSLPELLREFDNYGSAEMFSGMVIGDCITLNTDRHYKNFGWYVDTVNMRRVRMAPVFDFNLSMATYADDVVGFDDLDKYMSDKEPVIGSNYVDPAKALLTPEYRAKLINMKDLVLTIPCDDKFTEDRLEKMNVIKNVQIDRILGRKAFFQFR